MSAFNKGWKVVKDERIPECCDGCNDALYDAGAYRGIPDGALSSKDIQEMAAAAGDSLPDHDCYEVQKEYYGFEERYETHRCVCSCH